MTIGFRWPDGNGEYYRGGGGMSSLEGTGVGETVVLTEAT